MSDPFDKDQPIDPTIEPTIERTIDVPEHSTVDQVDEETAEDTVDSSAISSKPSKPSEPSKELSSEAATRFGDYELLSEIARGGMGVVFKARQIKANRIVALKMILAGGFADQQEVRRFYAEAEAAANLDHPNIVPVYDAGEVDGQHFFSMGFVDGNSLAAEVSDGPLEPAQAVRIMATVSQAIAYAHSKHIIHRDLKPANILVDREGNPRVTDFGLAKQIKGDSDLTATGQVMGTPSFMPPEQAMGRIDQVGPLSDVYSLGAVLYQLLTGRPPFRAASLIETLKQVVDQEPVAPRQLNPAIDLDLNTIALKALEKNPDRRYGSAKEFADDLERYLEHRPISARRISTTGRVVRWAKRNKIVAALLTLTTLFLVATTAVSIIAAIQFRNEGRRQSESAEIQTRLRKRAELAQKETSQSLYDAEVSSAGVALAAPSGIGKVRELVEHWSPGEHGDLLGWEWYFLNAVSHREQRVMVGFQFPNEVRWHPDGRTIALTGELHEKGGVYLANVDKRDASTGFISADTRIKMQSLCWDTDGKWIAAGGGNVVAAWDYPSRKQRWRREFPGEVFGAICYCPKLKLIAARSRKGEIFVLNEDSGETETTLEDREAVEPNTIQFSPNGQWLVTSLNQRPDGTIIRIFNTKDWSVYAELPSLDPMVFGLAWSPDSQLLASGGDEGIAQIFDVPRKELRHKLHLHKRRITDLAWNPDGKRLATCSEDFTTVICEPEIYERFERLRGHTDTVRFIDWTQDGRRLISVGKDYKYRVWDLEAPSPDEEIDLNMASKAYAGRATLQWHPSLNELIMSLDGPGDAKILTWNADQKIKKTLGEGLKPTWSHDGKYIAAVVDQSVCVYTADGTLFKQTDFEHEDVYVLDWHPTEYKLALNSQKLLDVWDIRQSKPKRIRDDARFLRAATWSPDGKKIAMGALGFYLDICDPETGELLNRSTSVVDMYTTDIDWSPDGKQIANTAMDRTDVMIWNVNDLSSHESLTGHSYGLWHVQWSPDGNRIASSGRDDTVRIWNPKSKKLLLTIDHHTVDGIGWSQDGLRLAGLGKHGRLKIWDATHGYEVRGSALINDRQWKSHRR